MRSYLEWALNLISDLLISLLWEDTEAHTEERRSWEGKGRDGVDGFTMSFVANVKSYNLFLISFF